jgi:AcrR family transcriptional regulator
MSSQSNIKYKRLIEKAEELFLRYGYKAVSMDQIAKEASISKMTIYKHFQNKDDLFVAVLLDLTDFHMQKIKEELLVIPHTLDKIERIYTYSLDHKNDFSDILIQEIMERSYVMDKVGKYKQKWALQLWKDILVEGVKNGEIRPMDIDFTAQLLMNMPLALKESDYMSDPNSIYKILESFYDFVKYGLLGNSPQTINEQEEAPRYDT